MEQGKFQIYGKIDVFGNVLEHFTGYNPKFGDIGRRFS